MSTKVQRYNNHAVYGYERMAMKEEGEREEAGEEGRASKEGRGCEVLQLIVVECKSVGNNVKY